ncbi:MAG: GntR family transcriptional regulator [Syntrophomonadaceae bacterium]|jgi:GntR family transcriptional regulator|nr:GntR family transcriptional regulator [Syntrophomonadaceae bacterium]
MKFEIDFDSGIPIYIQLKNEIKYAIATGKIPPGSQLPTVRQLAVDLKVNVNTISRVYSELEKEGVLSTRQGKGTFVSEKNVMKTNGRNKERLDQLVDKLFIEAFELGFSPEELLEYIQRRFRLKTK